MNETAAPEAKPTTVRLDPDIRALLNSFCSHNRRTLNSAINYLLDQALRSQTQAQVAGGVQVR